MSVSTRCVGAASRGPRLRGLLRRSRLVRLLACFGLVPLVVFSNPSTASAATVPPGPWQSLSIYQEVVGSQDYVGRGCKLNVRHTGAAVEVGSNGWCWGLPDVTPGWAGQPGEAGTTFTLTFDGTNAAGSDCGATYGGTLTDHPNNGTVRVAGGIPGGLATITGGVTADIGTCDVTQVCLRLSDTGFECDDYELLAPEDGPETGTPCVHGTPTLKYEWEKTVTHQPGYYTFELALNLTVKGAGVSTATWYATVQGNYGRTPTAALMQSRTVFKTDTWMNQAAPRPVGIEVWAVPDSWNVAGDTSRPFVVSSIRPDDSSDPYAGWTQPEHCRFYFGAQIVNDGDPSTQEDIPAGDGVSEPVVEPPPDEVEPVVETPPVEDEDAFDLGALWALLRMIWQAIVDGLQAVVSALTGLVTGIVDGVVNGIKGLFVPDSGFFDAKVDQVDQKVEGSTVGNYVAVFDGIEGNAGQGGQGCVGPGVTLPFGGGGTFHPLSACDGVMATAAGIGRSVIAIGFAVTAFFACLRILGSGFGWNPTPSGGVQ